MKTAEVTKEKIYRTYKIITRQCGKEDKIFIEVLNETQIKDLKRRFPDGRWVFEKA